MSTAREKLFRQLYGYLAVNGIIRFSPPHYIWRNKDQTREITLAFGEMERITGAIIALWYKELKIRDISEVPDNYKDNIRLFVDQRILDYYGEEIVGE